MPPRRSIAKSLRALHIPGEGLSHLTFTITPEDYSCGGRGARDDLFQDARSMRPSMRPTPWRPSRFLLTTKLQPAVKPRRCAPGPDRRKGAWYGSTHAGRVFVAEARLVYQEGGEIGRGTGTFMARASRCPACRANTGRNRNDRIPAHIEAGGDIAPCRIARSEFRHGAVQGTSATRAGFHCGSTYDGEASTLNERCLRSTVRALCKRQNTKII